MRTSLPALVAATLALTLCSVGCAPETPPSDAAGAKTETASTPASTPAETPKPADTKKDEVKSDTDSTLLAEPKEGEEVAVLETAKGKIVLMFFPDKAPNHVENFKSLVGSKFYDGTRFHRCIPGFMVQGGDPYSKSLDKATQWGMGGNTVDGQEKNLKAEFNSVSHKKGIVSMARGGTPDSASSQFFIVAADSNFLDGQYSAFGKVVSGQDVVDKIVLTGDAGNNGAVEPTKAIVLKTVRIAKWPLK